jgi:hypothetical protein
MRPRPNVELLLAVLLLAVRLLVVQRRVVPVHAVLRRAVLRRAVLRRAVLPRVVMRPGLVCGRPREAGAVTARARRTGRPAAASLLGRCGSVRKPAVAVAE